jgi:hypothetical protein
VFFRNNELAFAKKGPDKDVVVVVEDEVVVVRSELAFTNAVDLPPTETPVECDCFSARFVDLCLAEGAGSDCVFDMKFRLGFPCIDLQLSHLSGQRAKGPFCSVNFSANICRLQFAKSVQYSTISSNLCGKCTITSS